jgi:hypothetical protein
VKLIRQLYPSTDVHSNGQTKKPEQTGTNIVDLVMDVTNSHTRMRSLSAFIEEENLDLNEIKINKSPSTSPNVSVDFGLDSQYECRSYVETEIDDINSNTTSMFNDSDRNHTNSQDDLDDVEEVDDDEDDNDGLSELGLSDVDMQKSSNFKIVVSTVDNDEIENESSVNEQKRNMHRMLKSRKKRKQRNKAKNRGNGNKLHITGKKRASPIYVQ